MSNNYLYQTFYNLQELEEVYEREGSTMVSTMPNLYARLLELRENQENV